MQDRENHGLKSKDFIIKYYDEELKHNPFYNDILDAVANHSSLETNSELSLFSKLVQFSDKMDFTYKRLEKDYKDKYGYLIYENIRDVDYIYTDKIFRINIISDKTFNVLDIYDKIKEEKFSNKIINVTISLANQLKRTPKLYVDGIEQKI